MEKMIMNLNNLITLPQYDFELPSNKKKIKFRPFVTRERKILLMALEGNDEEEILTAIKQIITNCVVEPKDFDLDKMASFDLESFFLRLRAKSIGEIQTLNYTCKNMTDGGAPIEPKVCGAPLVFELNLLDVAPEEIPGHDPKIMFTDKVGVMMRYPTLDTIKIADQAGDGVSAALDYIVNCVEYIFDEENIYYAKDMKKEEISEFIENLTDPNFSKIENFLQTIPVLKKTLEQDCPKCKFHHEIVLEGLQSFFD